MVVVVNKTDLHTMDLDARGLRGEVSPDPRHRGDLVSPELGIDKLKAGLCVR